MIKGEITFFHNVFNSFSVTIPTGTFIESIHVFGNTFMFSNSSAADLLYVEKGLGESGSKVVSL